MTRRAQSARFRVPNSPAGVGHVAVRRCVGCGQRDAQADLIRLARCAHGRVQVDAKRRLTGRGAYLHNAKECLDLFSKRRGMLRSLRMVVDASVRMAIVAELRDERSLSEG